MQGAEIDKLPIGERSLTRIFPMLTMIEETKSAVLRLRVIKSNLFFW